ncbi:MAG: DUF3316 domain-containing protein [Bacteroidaceae bacterium]|nr:DUF3316 domain-containing protein [Bacteroidaceae bacterium]
MRHTLFIISAFFFSCAYAQIDSLRMRSTLFGLGAANILDSYLSPYSYKGIEARIIHQTERQTKLWNGHISYNTQIDINATYVKNPAKNVKEYAGGIRYSNAWLYHFADIKQWHFATGLAASGYAGGIYNDRNGNNPAQGKFDLMIDLTGKASYNFRVKGKQWQATYNLSCPLVGIAFSPMFGQSYYEIFSLKDYDHNCVFANFINTPSMRHLITLDIPIGRNTLRIGYAAEFMQSKWNGIRYHAYSHNFMIGFTKHIILK